MRTRNQGACAAPQLKERRTAARRSERAAARVLCAAGAGRPAGCGGSTKHGVRAPSAPRGHGVWCKVCRPEWNHRLRPVPLAPPRQVPHARQQHVPRAGQQRRLLGRHPVTGDVTPAARRLVGSFRQDLLPRVRPRRAATRERGEPLAGRRRRAAVAGAADADEAAGAQRFCVWVERVCQPQAAALDVGRQAGVLAVPPLGDAARARLGRGVICVSANSMLTYADRRQRAGAGLQPGSFCARIARCTPATKRMLAPPTVRRGSARVSSAASPASPASAPGLPARTRALGAVRGVGAHGTWTR